MELVALPSPAGSATLELLVGDQILKVFDRGDTPVSSGPLVVLLHGVASRLGPHSGESGIRPLGAGRFRISGQRGGALAPGFFLLTARVPFVIYSEAGLPESEAVWVETAPPLMGFRP